LDFGLWNEKNMRGIHFVALAHMVGWVKRDVGTIYVGFAYLNAPPKFEITTKPANPTGLGAVRRLNPTYDLSLRPTKWIAPKNIISTCAIRCNSLKFIISQGGLSGKSLKISAQVTYFHLLKLP
jgi:hypothetical protein